MRSFDTYNNNNCTFPSALLGRESALGPRTFEGWLTSRRCAQLGLVSSRHVGGVPQQGGGITWLDLDPSESRYLLAAASDATIAVYDTQGARRGVAPGSALSQVCMVRRTHAGAHQYLVSCVAWYPHDSGMFVSGSYDNTVKLWDTNALDVVSVWPLPAKVTCVALSGVLAAEHCLVAAACQEPALRLCDPRTGAFTHTLVGHRHPIWSVAWSMRSEHELVSGDAIGQVCVWDVRRFGPLHLLDQYCTHRPVKTQPLSASQGGPSSAQGHQLGSHAVSNLVSAASPGTQLPQAQAPGQARVASMPADLDAVVSSAWATISTLSHLPQRSNSSKTDTHAPAAKRARAGTQGHALSRPGSLDIAGAPAGVQVAGRRAASMDSGGPRRRGGAHTAAPADQYHYLPLSASAPGHRPGRVGDAIGGRAPSGPGNRPGYGQLGNGSAGPDGTAAAAAAAGAGLGDEAVRAHQGAVTCVLPSPDGLAWFTAGTDSRLHTWDALLWHRHVVGFTDTFNRAIRGRRVAVTGDGRVVFHPCGSSVQVFDAHTGQLLADLEGGHTESINACAWNGLLGELYSAANDGCIRVWAPRHAGAQEGDSGAGSEAGDDDDGDDGDDGGGAGRHGRGDGRRGNDHDTDDDDSGHGGGPPGTGHPKKKAQQQGASGGRPASASQGRQGKAGVPGKGGRKSG